MYRSWEAIRGQLPESTELCVVSKLKPLAQMLELYDEISRARGPNITLLFGENYQTEVIDKLAELESLNRPTPGLGLSLIGKLQTNKIAPMFKADQHLHLIQRIETIDSLKLARKLDDGLAKYKRAPIEVFIQVNISGEPQKNGVTEDEVRELVRAIDRECTNLLCGGLMCVPSHEHPDDEFRRMAELRERLEKEFKRSFKLSMGMSGDWQTAVKHKTNEIRIGTAIMGAR